MKCNSRLAGIILPVMLLAACQPEVPGVWMKLSGTTQGTTYNLTYQAADSTDYQVQIEEILAGFDRSLSTYLESSLISGFNRDSVGVIPDSYFKNCFLAAQKVNSATEGAFDITVAPIVNAWGFGFTDAAEVDSSLIKDMLGLVGMELVGIDGEKIIKHQPGVMLDMNAIAQGYAVDVLYDYFQSEGLENFLIEIGGEVRTRGINPGGTGWRIGIDRPVDGLQVPGAYLQAIVRISDRSLATSGNYRRFYEKDGMKYSHTIDPSSGWPVQHGLLSATVLADECMYADAYATAFMVMGFEKSREFLADHPRLDAYLIYNDEEGKYRIWYTDELSEFLEKGKN